MRTMTTSATQGDGGRWAHLSAGQGKCSQPVGSDAVKTVPYAEGAQYAGTVCGWLEAFSGVTTTRELGAKRGFESL